MNSLTPQQQAILDQTGDQKVVAVAGSGKTTTLIRYAASRPANKKILYLAFNRSVKLEAEQKFKAAGLSNVQVDTAHSLAWRFQRSKIGELTTSIRLPDLADALRIRKTRDSGYRFALAAHVLRYISLYCNHPVSQLKQLNYLQQLDDNQSRAFADRHIGEILRYGQLFYQMMLEHKHPMLHDVYLKEFQLTERRLPFDFLLFDEAQDASAVMLEWFRRQEGTKLLVGDPHQQIYSWRYAVNAMNRLPYPESPLSHSFRFPPHIAQLASQVISWKSLISDAKTNFELHGWGTEPASANQEAWLARTNLVLLGAAIERLEERPDTHFWFEGDFKAYTFAAGSWSVSDLLALWQGRNYKVRDPVLRTLGSFGALETYCEQTGDAELNMLMELIKRYGGGLNERLQQLRKQVVSADNREKADLILSTVHRAKGLEYDRVKLLPDFITEKKLRKMLEEKKKVVRPDKLIEEINLLYVALTRSRGHLLVPDDWFELDVKGTEKYIVTKKEEVMVHEGEIPYCSTPSSVGNLYVGKRVTRKPTEIRKTRTSNHSSNFYTRKSSKKKNMPRE